MLNATDTGPHQTQGGHHENIYDAVYPLRISRFLHDAGGDDQAMDRGDCIYRHHCFCPDGDALGDAMKGIIFGMAISIALWILIIAVLWITFFGRL